MKLNPAKYTFLGFMVAQRGIEVNLAQIKAVLETLVPNRKKELQRLTSHQAACGCFIARFTDKLRHLFLTLRGATTFDWTDE